MFTFCCYNSRMNTLFINDRGVSLELLHILGSLPAAQLARARKIAPAP